MLRVSAKVTQTDIDLAGINGSADAAAQGIEFGDLLMSFAEAVASRAPDLADCREALLNAAGSDVLVDAAGVAANFQRMVRIADSIGIPVDDMTTELGQSVRDELDLTRFASAQNTLAH
ncbi:MAG: hypothetical protein ACI9ON_001558 [Limisphaerales bacterium]|jgi:hypothetical protein